MNFRDNLATSIISALAVCPRENWNQQLLVILSEYNIKPCGVTSNIGEYVRRFLGAKRIEGLSQKTLKNYQRYLDKFAVVLNKDAGRITANDIRAYVTQLCVKDSSLQTILSIFRSFFGWLVREELLRKNPMNKIISPKTQGRVLRRALSIEALERLRNACQTSREKALVEFLYSTGCRVTEASSILLPEVDFSTRSIRIVGKGSSERIVYFSVKASLLLQDYLHDRASGDYLFTNTRAPFGRMSARSMEKVVHTLGIKAALVEPVYPHLLRHTLATSALNAGMNITSIQKLLGHRQLSTTQIYASISMENVRFEYQKFVS